MSERIVVSDEEWVMIAPLLPSERGRGCRPAHDNRRFFEGMLWIARTGAQWRHLPAEYGKWNSIYQRFRRWAMTGVWDAMLQTLSELAGPDHRQHMIDSTVIRAHQNAAGVKGGIKTRRLWGALAAASPQKSTRGATGKVGRSGLSSPAAKSTMVKRSKPSSGSSKTRSRR